MKINRYDIPVHPLEYGIPNNVFGQWCRAIDVAKLEELNTELLTIVRDLIEEDEDDYYSDYRMVARKAREVIARLEGTA